MQTVKSEGSEMMAAAQTAPLHCKSIDLTFLAGNGIITHTLLVLSVRINNSIDIWH